MVDLVWVSNYIIFPIMGIGFAVTIIKLIINAKEEGKADPMYYAFRDALRSGKPCTLTRQKDGSVKTTYKTEAKK